VFFVFVFLQSVMNWMMTIQMMETQTGQMTIRVLMEKLAGVFLFF
jgi:hypothetical protein